MSRIFLVMFQILSCFVSSRVSSRVMFQTLSYFVSSRVTDCVPDLCQLRFGQSGDQSPKHFHRRQNTSTRHHHRRSVQFRGKVEEKVVIIFIIIISIIGKGRMNLTN